jgi:hypothetical protein
MRSWEYDGIRRRRDMKKEKGHKKGKKIGEKLDEAFAHIAYAEAGELYQANPRKRGKKGQEPPVCVRGETKSGLCV